MHCQIFRHAVVFVKIKVEQKRSKSCAVYNKFVF